MMPALVMTSPNGRNLPGHGNEQLRKKLKDLGEKIRWHARSAAEDILSIGEDLTEAKKLCRHGEWQKWLTYELGWNDRQARSYMQVYRVMGDDLLKTEHVYHFENIDVRALFILSRSTTPAQARAEALRLARDGVSINASRAKALRREAKTFERKEKERLEEARIEAAKTPAQRREDELEELRQERWSSATLCACFAMGFGPLAKQFRECEKYGVDIAMLARAFVEDGIDLADIRLLGKKLTEIGMEAENYGNVRAFKATAAGH